MAAAAAAAAEGLSFRPSAGGGGLVLVAADAGIFRAIEETAVASPAGTYGVAASDNVDIDA